MVGLVARGGARELTVLVEVRWCQQEDSRREITSSSSSSSSSSEQRNGHTHNHIHENTHTYTHTHHSIILLIHCLCFAIFTSCWFWIIIHYRNYKEISMEMLDTSLLSVLRINNTLAAFMRTHCPLHPLHVAVLKDPLHVAVLRDPLHTKRFTSCAWRREYKESHKIKCESRHCEWFFKMSKQVEKTIQEHNQFNFSNLLLFKRVRGSECSQLDEWSQVKSDIVEDLMSQWQTDDTTLWQA